ncbi:MAG: tRNA (adenosine(37)-N6)-threonylcarbamoyltransferase complex transferase subunit TsaD [Planctomycetota bacterium]
MIVLGLESSCDETAAAIVDDGLTVRSSVVSSQADLHAEYGGVVPEIAGRAHVERVMPVIQKALSDAGLSLDHIDALAVGHRPGLIGSLLVGVSAAKTLAWSLGKPLVGVDHVHAHLWAALLERSRTDLADAFPALGLVVSGGHTAIYRLDSPTDLVRLGSTIDDALGEAYDKVASMLGLDYPGGPQLDQLAQDPSADATRFDLPYSHLGKGSLDFSFSGLKTAALYAIRGVPRPKNEGGGFPRELADFPDTDRRDLAAAFQETAATTVSRKLKRAAETFEPRSLIAGGGVTANSRLRAELDTFARTHKLRLFLPPMRFCVDNAAMIAGLGHELLAAGEDHGITLRPVPTTAC